MLSIIVPIARNQHLDCILHTMSPEWQIGDLKYEVVFMNDIQDNVSHRDAFKLLFAFQDKYADIPVRVGGSSSVMGNCKSRRAASDIASGDTLVFVDGDQLLAKNFVQAYTEFYESGDYDCGIGMCGIDLQIREDETCWISAPRDDGGIVTYERMLHVSDVFDDVELCTLRDRMLSIVNPYLSGGGKAICPGPEKHNIWHYPKDKTNPLNYITRNCSMKKSVFEKLGGFDMELNQTPDSESRGWEDIELGIRAARAGYTFGMVDTFSVHLQHKINFGDLGKANLQYLIRKHLDWFIQHPDWCEGKPIATEIFEDLKKST